MSQSPGSPKPGLFRDSTLGVPWQTTTWVWARQSNAKNTIGRIWWWHLPSPGRGVSCESELACGLSQHQRHAEWVLTNLCWFWMQVHDQIAWFSLIPGPLARPCTPFSARSRERPPSPNFPQLYIVEPSSGFNKGLRSALEHLDPLHVVTKGYNPIDKQLYCFHRSLIKKPLSNQELKT
jgi:hypothetical protein